MIFSRLLGQLFSALRMRGRRSRLDRLHRPEVTRKILIRERGRTDRTGDVFSVVTFTPRQPELAEDTWLYLVELLSGRLRSTDDMGWLNDRQLCAVLPHTTPDKAWKVADAVCLKFPERLAPPLCTVYCYPWDGKPENGWTPATNAADLAPSTHPVLSLEPMFVKHMPLWKRGLDVVLAALALVTLLP